MSNVLPFDLGEILLEDLRRGRRANDGLLHASSHLTGSLRHAELDVVGAPKVESELLSEITLATGTMWHEYLHSMLRRQGVPYMAEVNVTPWMPLGWGGTLDGLFLNPDLDAFVLGDFKTIKGEGMRYIVKDGAKLEHILQLSIYWHAAKKMLGGTAKIAKTVGVWYLPKNDTRDKNELIEPVLADFEPIPWDELTEITSERTDAVAAYKASLPKPNPRPLTVDEYVTDALAPVQERQQVVYRDRATGTWDVLLKPHWSTAYCPYPVELCDCSTQGQTKIGMYDVDGSYIPRSGYEDITPTVHPNERS
jgi:hypothetical protein